MRKRIVLFAAVLLLVVVGCSSSDPTMSEEYSRLEGDLAESEIQLAEVTAERDALVEDAETAAAPVDVAAVTAAWGEAVNRGDGSVVGLYTSGGYHLYGNAVIGRDDIAGHLENPSETHEWISEPFVLIDEDGRYVVARGARTTGPGITLTSSVTFEIVELSDGELLIKQSAWLWARR
ncbi:MAG: hypothetical protein ABFR95_01365 [Actinomycetota bacterium]